MPSSSCRSARSAAAAACLLILAAGSDAAVRPDSTRHNLVAIEFRDSPAQGFALVGGSLGVPDSSGLFPPRLQRQDGTTGQFGPRGVGVGNLLVFTDLAPGTYRVGVFLFEQSATVRRLMPKKPAEPLEDFCHVYGDSIPQLTFTIGPHQARYLGQMVRRTRPTLGSDVEMWKSSNTWAPGDSMRAWRTIRRKKSLAAWHDLVPAAIGRAAR